MPIFVFHFKAKPKSGFHLTIKLANIAAYVRAENLEEARKRGREYISSYHWIISSVVTDGFEYNPVLHELPDEALQLCRQAKQYGAAIGVAAVGIDPNHSGENN